MKIVNFFSDKNGRKSIEFEIGFPGQKGNNEGEKRSLIKSQNLNLAFIKKPITSNFLVKSRARIQGGNPGWKGERKRGANLANSSTLSIQGCEGLGNAYEISLSLNWRAFYFFLVCA